MTNFKAVVRVLAEGGVRAAGRPKDLEAIAKLEVLLEERRRGGA
jgi:hypothetical protein